MPLLPAPVCVRRAIAAIALLVAAATPGCGGHDNRPTTPRKPTATRLRLAHRATLPAPVQLPGLARTDDGRILAVGGLDAADASTTEVTQVLPGPARTCTRLPQAAHDIGATAIGRTVYAFGGGTYVGPTAAIIALDDHGSARTAANSATSVRHHRGHAGRHGLCDRRLHHLDAAAVGARLPPGQRDPTCCGAAAPRALRGRRRHRPPRLRAGGTTGTRTWRDIVEVDPRTHRAAIVGHLPHPLAHAAGATLNGRFYILGGRGDAPDSQVAAIWAFDPRTRRLKRAGRLPLALSDQPPWRTVRGSWR